MSELAMLKKFEFIHGRCLYDLNSNQQITGLYLSNRKLENIDFLISFSNLIQLDLSLNQLGNISILKNMPCLTKLYLNNNQLNDISVLKDLPNLTHLYLSDNKLTDISILKYLPNITHLNLNRNLIKDISCLEKLNKLVLLHLRENELSDINPLKELKNLVSLNLADNQIRTLPEWLVDFDLNIKWEKNLKNKTILLEGNPLKEPPIEIIKQGNEAISSYFKQLKKGVDCLYEAKLILVGEGGAGKTSLANKIINPDWPLISENESQSTQGIEILRYEFPYKDKTFKVNIWDFGGQEIYHQTHQFFLSKRALYLLLADNRKEDSDFYYWLNTVGMLSDHSPLLIIKNEKSDRKRQFPESQLKADFNNIKAILATNLSDNRGLNTIIEDLQHYLGQLPHIGSPLPKTWVKVREELEHDDRYYIDLKDYFKICQANGFESEADKRQLSGYLHDLGVCLHFQEHDLLDKTLILKPTWATDAVYKVLDNSEVIKHSGRFNKDDLKQIWQAEQYSEMRGELLALMQKFKLCYEIPNQKNYYISPQLLEDKVPIMTGSPLRTSSHGQDLLLRYQYDFMPKGIISQFIVIMHSYIAHDYQWVWKSGVILEKDNTQAEIIEYYGKREIHIRVVGQNKKELLNIVSFQLDEINRSYQRLKDKCRKLVPCLCEKCSPLAEPHFFSYSDLNSFKQKNVQSIQCLKSGQMINVLKLIDDIDLPGFKNLEGLNHEAREVYNNCTFNQANGEMSVTNEEHNITADNSQVQQFNQSNGNTANQTENKAAEIKEDNLFKKPLFYIAILAFIYFMAVAWGAYNLQQKGLLGNKTFKEIVLAPIPLLKSEDKK